jgi:endonuclease III
MSGTSNGWGKPVCIGCLFALALVTTLPAQTKWTSTDGQRQTGMMADCQKMMADMKAGQEKLDDLIAEMNAATGQQKIDRIAAVLTELVARQKAMHAHMTMMGHGSAPLANSPGQQPPAGHEQRH